MKIGFPRLGKYTELIEQLGSYLKWDLIIPSKTSEPTIEAGAKYMNEFMCLPAKVTLGNFIEACKEGASDLVMFDSCGMCRLKCYWILQQRALNKLGYGVKVHPVRLGRTTPGDICRIDSSIPWWRAWLAFIKLIRLIREIDDNHHYDLMKESKQVKLGIVGEIYTILEPAVNMDIIKKLEQMGALVHNSLPLSYFVFKPLYNKGLLRLRGMDPKIHREARRLAHKIFPKEIGGHGNEAIINTIYYALTGFDGVIHVLPFPCMPESTVATILDDISHDYKIPLMRLIFDTHTAEAGLNTRLEAFTDILKKKKTAQTKQLTGG